MAKRHYIIYCDESAKKGEYFSNFFGGVLLQSSDQEAIDYLLRKKKEELNLHSEIKWTSVTKPYLQKYIDFIKFYFEFVESSRLRVRVMFTQNIHRPVGLTKEQREERYFRLYYQFIKHGFGVKYSNPNALDRVFFSLLLDDIPDTKAKFENFKDYLSRIPNTYDMRGCQIHFPRNQITDVNSANHSILQGLDVILGSMNFRLNDHHRKKPEGQRIRGKRTIAKEKLYKEINKLIRSIYPNFNVGTTTGTQNGLVDRWRHPYRHWRFIPTDYKLDQTATKRKAP